MLPLYDLILVPETAGACSLPFGAVDPSRVRWLGPILTREKVELLDRWEARERLGAHPNTFLLYVSVGSGADTETQELVQTICTAVMDEPDVHIVIGGAPMFFGSLLQGPRITWLNGPSLDVMLAFDAAICDAGYNTYHELTATGIPTAWIPRRTLGDDQVARVQRSMELEPILLDPEDLRGSQILRVLAELRERRGQRPHEAGGPAAYRSFARDAADAILSTIWPADDVNRAVSAVDDEVLGAAADMSLPAQALVAFARWVSGEPKAGPAATQATCALFSAMFAHALYPPLGSELVKPLCSVLPAGEPSARVGAIIALLDAMACFEDWNAAKAFLAYLDVETSLSLPDFRDAVIHLLAVGAEHGLSLQDVGECIQATRAHGRTISQREAIRLLTDRLTETAQPKLRAI